MSRLGFGIGPWTLSPPTVVAGPAAKYVVTSTSYAPAAGAAVTISAQLTDAAGIPVHTAGLVVTWTKSDPGGSFASGTSTTNALGLAIVSFTTSSTPTTSTTVTATDTNAMTGTSATITTTGAGGGPAGVYCGDGFFGNGYFGPVYLG